MDNLRIGIIGLGTNTRLRHVPGLLEIDGVNITAVCNRRTESTRAAAEEFGIGKIYNCWQDLVADEEIDAILIGTWPYLHCEITLAALAAGKHVLTEARMAMNAAEAWQMLAAVQRRPELVAQIVPSPLGMRAHRVVKELLADGYIGELREFVVLGTNNSYVDPAKPLHWRQSRELSGLNMLALGILHEPLVRWIPDPIRVSAHTHVFTPQQPDEESGEMRSIGTPDSVQVLTELSNGAHGIYHLSSAIHFGPSMQIHLYGSEGTLKYLLAPEDLLLGARKGDPGLAEIKIPPEKAGDWRVEEEFVWSIRGKEKVEFNDFATGVRYMEFTEAVARSGENRVEVRLPLACE